MTAEANQRVPTGPSWVSLSASLCKGEVMHRLQQIADTGIFPTLVTKGKSILSQRYSGDINIFPKINYADFPRVLSNPTPEYMKGCMLTGQRATWPKLSRIQNHVAIELALDDTIQKLKGQLVFSPSQNELGIRRTSSQGNVLSHAQKAAHPYKMARFTLRTQPPSPVLQKSAPTSPRLYRAAARGFAQPLCIPDHINMANRPKRWSTGVPSTDAIQLDPGSSTNETSDQDYFADPDSDTTGRESSPSPLTSPTFQVPTLWPSTPPTRMRAVSQPAPPCTATPVNRRTGTLLNLTMTSASSQSSIPNAPSSPELRYKRLFHPPGPATPDVCVGPPILDGEPAPYANPSPCASRSGSRRNSGAGLPFDHSGTRAMLLRKKSFM